MNLGANIAVYAAICKHLNLPFTFPGGRKAYGGQIFWDASDAYLIAEHLIWEATTKEAANQVNAMFSVLDFFVLCQNYKRLIFWDASDADLIAEHLIWEATTKEAANQVNDKHSVFLSVL